MAEMTERHKTFNDAKSMDLRAKKRVNKGHLNLGSENQVGRLFGVRG